MKIAFVNQPIDSILPPYQSSVGACTFGLACSLAKSCEVIVYGATNRHRNFPADFRDHDVHFRFFSVPTADRIAVKAKEKYLQLFPSSAPASSSNWLYQSFFRMVARDLTLQAPDVIHVQHCSPYLPQIRAFNPRAKIVLQLHAEWFSQNWTRALRKFLCSVDLVTTVSDHIANKVQRLPKINFRCETVYNGINSADFRREKDYSSSLRWEKRILYAGAVSPHKGLHILLDAFKIVIDRFPNVRLDIVGPQGTYPLAETFDLQHKELILSMYSFYYQNSFSNIKSRLLPSSSRENTYLARLQKKIPVEAKHKVAFLGFVPRTELIELYYNADVFVFPPIWDEGFGIPPVEAMAAGTPVVASRSGALSETIRDKETGFLVDKNDHNSLAESILKLLNNDHLRESMGQAARKRVQEHFVWDHIAKRVETRYLQLCANS